MRVLVTGCEGMLGRRLVEEAARRGHAVTGLDRPGFELARPAEAARQLREARPELVIHGAAITDVDGCESQAEFAMAINGEASGVLARGAAEIGARCVYVSTDYVFDGAKDAPYLEDDPTGPATAYGRSKLRGEEHRYNQPDPRNHELVICRPAWKDRVVRALAECGALED